MSCKSYRDMRIIASSLVIQKIGVRQAESKDKLIFQVINHFLLSKSKHCMFSTP